MTPLLRVLVYSEDRPVLGHLSRLLLACGYEVRQAADATAAALELETWCPHVLVVDAEPGLPQALEICRTASSGTAGTRPYIMMLCRAGASQAIAPAWEAGADDFLHRPVVYGELLARMRFAARALEFERRMARQPGVEPLTGLPNRAAFLHRLRRRLAEWAASSQPPQGPARPHKAPAPVPDRVLPLWVAVADVDRLSAINRRWGWPAGDAVLRHVAELLVHHAGQEAGVASFGAGRFAMLAQTPADQALAWAERIRTAIAADDWAAESALPATPATPPACGITVSLGVAPCPSGVPAEAAVAHAEQALAAAKAAGRNTACPYGEDLRPPKGWTDFAAAGRLFDRTRAGDVMSVISHAVAAEAPASQAWSLLRRTGAPALPVVERNGTLAGLILAENAPSTPQPWEGIPARQVMDRDVALEDESAPFERLREFFTRDSRPAVVVQRAGRPVGLVTADCLAALGVPVGPETFAAAELEGSAGLAVPDLRPLAAE